MESYLRCLNIVQICIYLPFVLDELWHSICVFSYPRQSTASQHKVGQFSKIARKSRRGAEWANHFGKHLIVCDFRSVLHDAGEEHLVPPLPNYVVVAFERRS